MRRATASVFSGRFEGPPDDDDGAWSLAPSKDGMVKPGPARADGENGRLAAATGDMGVDGGADVPVEKLARVLLAAGDMGVGGGADVPAWLALLAMGVASSVSDAESASSSQLSATGLLFFWALPRGVVSSSLVLMESLARLEVTSSLALGAMMDG
jgi:hypothetical protein